MTTRPISFKPENVRAILDGRKTQTRRVLKPQPPEHVTGAGRFGASTSPGFWKDEWSWLSGDQTDIDTVQFEGDFRTRLLEGDLLWVRETFTLTQHGDPVYRADARDKDGTRWPSITPGDPENEVLWKPWIHMPRKLSRLTLTVKEVRVQRLQEITGLDIAEEGIRADAPKPSAPTHKGMPTATPMTWNDGQDFTAVAAFKRLWDSIHAKKPQNQWSANPWVVATSFDFTLCNVDSMEADNG